MNEKDLGLKKHHNSSSKLHKFKDFLKKILTNTNISMEDDGYRTHYYRTGIGMLGGMCIDYDGKFKLHRTNEEIKQLTSKLIELLEKKVFDGFKFKNNKIPMVEKYKDTLPPIFVYCKNKEKENILKELKKLGDDWEWIDDNRGHIELQLAQRDSLN